MCNSKNWWFDKILPSTTPPANLFCKPNVSDRARIAKALAQDAFYQKKKKKIEGRSLWCPSCFEFLAMLNALSQNILSEVVLLGKSINHKP